MTTDSNLLAILWKANKFCSSDEAVKEFDEAYSDFASRHIRYSRLFEYPRVTDEMKRFLDKVCSLEFMLGLNGNNCTSVVFDKLSGMLPEFDSNKDEIYLTVDQQSRCSSERFYAINPSLNETLRQQDYVKYQGQILSTFHDIDLVSAKPLTDDEFKEARVQCVEQMIVLNTDIKLIKPSSLKGQQFEEQKRYYEYLDDQGKQYFAFNPQHRTHTYNQPNADTVERYIRLRTYSLKFMKKLEEYREENREKEASQPPCIISIFPMEEELLICLDWIKKVLYSVEDETYREAPIGLERPTYQMINNLSTHYPLIDKVIDFYTNKHLLSIRSRPRMEAYEGYKAIIKPTPLVDALKDGLRELRKNTKSYYIDKLKEFLSEDEITDNLENNIKNLKIPISASVQQKDGRSIIDLLLKVEGDVVQELAVEAKIAFKNGKFQKDEVKKGLFLQTPSYAEQVGERDSCAVLYAFDVNLQEINSYLNNLVKEESGWSLEFVKPNDRTHFKLISSKKDVEDYIYDVFVVCLWSESNTKKHKNKKGKT